MAHKTPQTIGDAALKLLAIKFNSIIAVKRVYDNWYFKQWWADKKHNRLRFNQKLDLSCHQELGSDLAVSRFVVGYCRGEVKDQNGRWLKSSRDLPQSFDESFKLMAIKAKEAGLVSEGIDNFVGLDHVESIDLSENPKLDDFACDQLARQFRKSKTLKAIDLSHNPAITVYGLDVLFRIPSLTKIVALGTRAAKYEDIDLFTLAALDERQCDVFVHPDGRQFINNDLEALRTTKPLLISSQ